MASLVLALGYLALLLSTVSDLGYVRDEGFYFQASQSYAKWFSALWETGRAALEPGVVDRAWSANHEHPALVKSLFALSNLILQQRFHLFGMEGTSYRFPAMVMASALVGLTYLWGARTRGRAAGLAAALLLAAMPRFFFHAHLACFDAPIVFMFALTLYAYARSIEGQGASWPIATGVLFGLALDTKHNSWFLPFIVGAHASFLVVRAWLLDPDSARYAKRAWMSLAAMALLGPLVFYALWPWIWHDTWARLQAYATFHLKHDYYNMEFLGQTYWQPPMPRAYAWVMTAATVPVVTLALFATGLLVRARARLVPLLRRLLRRAGPRVGRDPAATDLLWLLGLVVSYAAWLSPDTPIFGGTKHWMNAYPFLALFAGAGFSWLVRAARRELSLFARRSSARLRAIARGPLVEMTLAACVLAAPVTETITAHPWGLSSYTPLVFGASGGATLGLNRGFWGGATGAVVAYLNAEVPEGGTVYIHDTASQAWDMLRKDGRIRSDIRSSSAVSFADFGLYHHEQHMLGQDYQAWVAMGTVAPDHIDGLDGVPVIWVYRRRPAAR